MFYSNFAYLCDQQGVARSTVCTQLGMSANAWKRWETGSMPRGSTVDAVARFFSVDPDDMRHKDLSADQPAKDGWDARQELFDRTELRVLFDAAQNVPAYKLYETAAMLMKWKEDAEGR